MAVCRSILRTRSDAEEAAGDAFLELWKSAPRFDEARGSAFAFLSVLARSRAIDQARRMTRAQRGRAAVASQAFPAAVAGEEPLRSALDRERARWVQHSLERLAPRQRLLLELSFFEELSHRQIAERLDAPLGTVKSGIRRGLASLRRMLAASSQTRGEAGLPTSAIEPPQGLAGSTGRGPEVAQPGPRDRKGRGAAAEPDRPSRDRDGEGEGGTSCGSPRKTISS